MKTRRLALLCAAAVLLAAALAHAVRASARPPVQLVETVPVETRLGNPELPSALAVWLEMIRGARRSLDFEEFYLSTWPREPMEPVLKAVGEAAHRGVRVRLLLDARMHRTYPRAADSLGRLPGIAVRTVDFGRIAGGIQHSKFFLVDGRAVFLGSQNFDWRALRHIHELGVRIADPRVAREFARVFEMDWAAADTTRPLAPAPPAPPPPLPFRIVQARGDTVELWPSWSPQRFCPDSTLWDRDAIVRLLDGARSEIVLQLLSYSPGGRDGRDDTLDQALRRAAARGVRVRMMISDWEAGRPAMESLVGLSQVPGIEVRLSTVPEWSGGYIPFARVEHCKYIVADSLTAWVGTSNWEPDYFHSSRNVAVTLRNRPLALQARRVFETSWEAPTARPVHPGARFEAKIHGAEPPPGRVKYGE
jgi:phosphatidylserine/phosphatidylglycerophosphate/cardiolipin synthase-like enzyme